MPTPILFISGAWLSADCWDPWRARYQRAGHACTAPAWPYSDRPATALRRDPDPDLAALTLVRLVDHYARAARALPAPPILIGHGLGGLVVQLLLDGGLGAAGVGLGSLSPGGFPFGLSALGMALPALPVWQGIAAMKPGYFARRVAQTLSRTQQARLYRRLAVPAPRRPLIDALLSRGTAIDFRNPGRAPLLLIAGGEDRSMPAGAQRANYRRQAAAGAETTFRLYPGRGHLLMAEAGWEDIADYCRAWAETHTVVP